jgi:2-succinyl-5-enolpyruvyl-6-hydroxy-3-cyclohexene-1-carboxylate synthase
MNIRLAKKILERLSQQGVKDFVLCAGARNAPFVKLLGLKLDINVHHFFDERAAAFFALGRSQRDHRPVAVLTTSGTAAAELLPAAVEAHYTYTQLIFVTADRPKNYRGTGAPQAIEHVGIFSHYTKCNYDFDFANFDQVDEFELSKSGATHINVCFDEPLIDEAVENFALRDIKPSQINRPMADSSESTRITDFFAKAKKPLVVLGGLSTADRSRVFEFVKNLGAAVYAEETSGLRECEALSGLLLKSGAQLFSRERFAKYFDSVLRIGSVPTLRLWRDLEYELHDVPVLSVCDLHFSGLAREKQNAVSLDALLNNATEFFALKSPEFMAYDKKVSESLSATIAKYPNAEPSFFHWLSLQISNSSTVMLGNSLPIREWCLAATTEDKEFKIIANRGANGIDGLISTFIGAASKHSENWLVLGDLSALYDLNALAALKSADSLALRIVVINNNGGQIFQKIFKDKNFVNEHHFEFSKWAEMFGLKYLKVTTPQTLRGVLEDVPTVIEVCPSASETQSFWQHYEGAFQ